MSFKDFAMNLVTLGGHEQLEGAKANYEVVYRRYEANRNKLYRIEAAREARLAELGDLVIISFKAAKASRGMLRYDGRLYRASPSGPKLPVSGVRKKVTLINVDRVIEEYSSSIAVAGVGAGAAAAAGSWSLVALLGSASTGTAISSLSGVAATNATLAWLGGGALAAGGAGMAGGTLVLGGVVLAPIVAFAAWHSRSKMNDVNQEADKVRYADTQVLQAIEPTQSALKLIENCLEAVRPSAKALQFQVESAKTMLFPIWGWSLCKRWILRLIGRPFFSDEESSILERLEKSLIDFVGRFQNLQDSAQCGKG